MSALLGVYFYIGCLWFCVSSVFFMVVVNDSEPEEKALKKKLALIILSTPLWPLVAGGIVIYLLFIFIKELVKAVIE